ncbi:MAG: glutathione S-transferase family protein [Steroidobacteraceae bacterium]|jgi:glutathione S-transferase|nr:glutathione S-transferase family protein [Steroidobacteraceae bacterium]
MKLYGALASPYVARVVLLARVKGLDLKTEMPAGGLRSPGYLALNPFGKMPTLEHGGEALIESQVICEYLEDLHPAPALLPADALGRARVRTLCRVLDLYVAPDSGALFRQMNPATRDAAVVEAAKGKLAANLPILDALVGKAPHTGPAGISLADCALLPYLRLMRKTVVPAFGVADPLSLPNLAKWSECMAAHPVAGPFFAEYDAAVDAFLKMLRGG